MFRLKALTIRNFKSISEASLEIRDGLWVVEGVNNDDKKLLHNGVDPSIGAYDRTKLVKNRYSSPTFGPYFLVTATIRAINTNIPRLPCQGDGW